MNRDEELADLVRRFIKARSDRNELYESGHYTIQELAAFDNAQSFHWGKLCDFQERYGLDPVQIREMIGVKDE